MRKITLLIPIPTFLAFVTISPAQTTSVTLPNGRVLNIDRSSALGIEQSINALRQTIETQANADRFDADQRLRKLLEELRNQQALADANRILAETSRSLKKTEAEIQAEAELNSKVWAERWKAEYARRRAVGEKTGSEIFGTLEESLEISKRKVAADAAREKQETAKGTPWAAEVQKARKEIEQIQRESRPSDTSDPRWKEWSARCIHKMDELCERLGDGTTVFRLGEEVRQKIWEERIDHEVAEAEKAGIDTKAYLRGKYPNGHPMYDHVRLAKDLKARLGQASPK